MNPGETVVIKVLCTDYNSLGFSSWLPFTGQLLLHELRHKISNMVCVTSNASDQPAHMRSLIRAFASGLNILSVKLLTENYLEFLSLK